MENRYPFIDMPTNVGLTAGFQTGMKYALRHGLFICAPFNLMRGWTASPGISFSDGAGNARQRSRYCDWFAIRFRKKRLLRSNDRF
ncbi:MAG: hypothetical protein ACLTSX_01440 [Collinsella sp.]